MNQNEKKALFAEHDTLNDQISRLEAEINSHRTKQRSIVETLYNDGETRPVMWKGVRLTPVRRKEKDGTVRYYFRTESPNNDIEVVG